MAETKTEPEVEFVKRGGRGEVFHVVIVSRWENGQIKCRISFRRVRNRSTRMLEAFNKELLSDVGKVLDSSQIPSQIYNPMARRAYPIVFERR